MGSSYAPLLSPFIHRGFTHASNYRFPNAFSCALFDAFPASVPSVFPVLQDAFRVRLDEFLRNLPGSLLCPLLLQFLTVLFLDHPFIPLMFAKSFPNFAKTQPWLTPDNRPTPAPQPCITIKGSWNLNEFLHITSSLNTSLHELSMNYLPITSVHNVRALILPHCKLNLILPALGTNDTPFYLFPCYKRKRMKAFKKELYSRQLFKLKRGHPQKAKELRGQHCLENYQ